MEDKFCFAIDRGGTFTDVYARCPGGSVRVLKLLSVDPNNYEDAPTEGIRRVIQEETGKSIPRTSLLETNNIGWIRMGTTVATNALLERKGERMALAITEGFKDLLHIGNQARPNIFDLEIVCPDVLYEEVIEVQERVIPRQDTSTSEAINNQWSVSKTSTAEEVLVTKQLNEEKLRKNLKNILEKGIKSLAVVLIHSYMYKAHEERVGAIAEEMGFSHVSLSSLVIPMVKVVPRGFTACCDAYLTPHIRSYLKGFSAGFKNQLKGVNVLFMQSDGGLTQMDRFIGSRAILSGPAGGVVGYAMTSYQQFDSKPVIGFDMGGTSTDVSRYAGEYEHVFESTTAGITIQAPQLDVNTVAAGGGSRLFFRSGMFVVGPESAGAHPGPVCYKKGGPLAVTDANLVLGRLLPQYFPKIFGPKENEPLDKESTLKAFKRITDEVNSSKSDPSKHLRYEEVAMGFIRVANEAMCRPIRALTQAKGHDTSHHVLAVFGGAGGQHACAVARALGMQSVVIHKYAGILSAFGMALADVVHEAQEPCSKSYVPANFSYLDEHLEALEKECVDYLQGQGFSSSNIVCEAYLNLRYQGTDCALMCTVNKDGLSTKSDACKYGDFKQAFLERYQREFGFVIADRKIFVDDIRVRGIGKLMIDTGEVVPQAEEEPKIETVTSIYFKEGWLETRVYMLSSLLSGHTIPGPAIIMDKLSTILIEPGCVGHITSQGDVQIQVGSTKRDKIGTELDAIQLSIFSHRFMSLAEQMGRILQRTSISTNIKERLDFSCALFGPDGGLVSNAPHIPVHLGAMQETVLYQLQLLGDKLKDGDVLLSNHPTAGGSHLPDLTVITPVFYKSVHRPVFYVASRGHHADIGGITPGSMPPHSTSIHEEGAVFLSFKLVDQGIFQEKKLIEALMDPGKIPGSSGTRNLKDNLSDLRAQVAANHRGILLVNELIDYYSLDVVQAYMGHIQSNAEVAVKELLKEVGCRIFKKTGVAALHAIDYMDDGSPIELTVNINIKKETAVFDFGGTGPEIWGNCNAPRAITVSAVIYCLRSMVGHDIPLNQGCLKPISIKIPPGCLLDPSPDAAVVGGNVQTSQRVVDVILRAFGVCAASQGCMNNVTFGDESIGYYETVAGGAGAGPTWHGRSGVHVHMTNTRITDPEILETRYPVILNKFTLNPGTGGNGIFRGGDGVARELLFRRPLTLSILTERRVFTPYGLEGGEDGQRGNNLLVRKCGRVIRLASKASVNVEKGDMFRLLTPGGGGFGTPDNSNADSKCSKPPKKRQRHIERGSVYEYTRAQESV
ncbi:5-oxoprolinase-like [Homarus americanus]|uniref:5-oxoprolinase-like n=1 Tax=Homarus americanus TaxID=6706 RepID=UPI001C496E7B|nr:5-oxoprolinase-like [Homarus americanus]